MAATGALIPLSVALVVGAGIYVLADSVTPISAAAQVAEALAVTTYTGIVDSAPFFANLEPRFQNYFTAARDQEMSHYLLEQRVTRRPASATTFFYPNGMFDDAQTTLNVLVSLEDAFIAAYLVGVRNLSSPPLRVLAARIMGVESDHRVLARVVGPNVATKDKGPIDAITGFQKQAESVDPPNDSAYERTLGLTAVDQVTSSLLRFADRRHAAAAGFDTARRFRFKPFKPATTQPLGELHSLAG